MKIILFSERRIMRDKIMKFDPTISNAEIIALFGKEIADLFQILKQLVAEKEEKKRQLTKCEFTLMKKAYQSDEGRDQLNALKKFKRMLPESSEYRRFRELLTTCKLTGQYIELSERITALEQEIPKTLGNLLERMETVIAGNQNE